MSASPRCTVGLLTWNGERDVAACVRSILSQTECDLEIVWVDNASSDSTRSVITQEFVNFPAPVVMEHNTGFCGGHNHAFALAKGRYYLALNQDAILSPDYIQTLCDWMDAVPDLGMTSGLILWGNDSPSANAKIYSAGLAMGHGRFPFELERDRAVTPQLRERRWVPGVTGAAMLIRQSAALDAASDTRELFPPEFFAYFEEVELAMRLAEAGWKCGVDGRAIAWHAERGQGGKAHSTIRAHYLKNHWLISLRHDSASDCLRELPAIIRGELFHYVSKYLTSPKAALSALAQCAKLIPGARRARREMLNRHPAAAEGRRRFYDESRRILRTYQA